MTARWRTLQKTFIAPMLIAEGTVIDWDGQPGPHLEPLNDEAEAALAAYYKENPDASLTPMDKLPMTMEPQPQVSIVSVKTAEEEVLDASALDPNKKAEPGLTAGGKAK